MKTLSTLILNCRMKTTITLWIYVFLLCPTVHFAQVNEAYPDSQIVVLTDKSLSGALNKAWWRYTADDDSAMANPNFDDSKWKLIQPGIIDSNMMNETGWLRLRFYVDSTLVNKPLALLIRHAAASEFYLNGRLINKFGVISQKDSTVYYDPQHDANILVFDAIGEHTFAIRYALYRASNIGDSILSVELADAETALSAQRITQLIVISFLLILLVIFSTLSFLHLLFFIFYKKNVSNFWFSAFLLCISGLWLTTIVKYLSPNPVLNYQLNGVLLVLASLSCSFFVVFLHTLFNYEKKLWMAIAFTLSTLTLLSPLFHSIEITLTLLLVYTTLYCIVSLLKAMTKRIKGASILTVGFGFFILSLLSLLLAVLTFKQIEISINDSFSGQLMALLLLMAIVSIPITMSVYQAWLFSKLNFDLTDQLIQVQKLSETTIKQEKEKKQIIESQNIKLEAMVVERTSQLTLEKQKSDALLRNILPEEIAAELKEKGRAEARNFDVVSILFTDFKGFTEQSTTMTANALVHELNTCFEAFDNIMEKYGIEKIKTIGDAYMAAGGLPVPTADSVKNTVLAALEMQAFIVNRKANFDAQISSPSGRPEGASFEMRVGIHTGPVVAGIVGVKKFQYDIWGDTVNTASRMESSGEVGKVNISKATYELLKDDPQFTFENRGKIEAKGKGEVEMLFVNLKK